MRLQIESPIPVPAWPPISRNADRINQPMMHGERSDGSGIKFAGITAGSTLTFSIYAQQKFYGKISIPAGAEITIFGMQDFAGTADAGIISATRTSPFGVLNIIGSNATVLNAGVRGYIDGHV